MSQTQKLQRPSLYVQFGCGRDAPEGWLNFDNSPALRLSRSRVLGPPARRAGAVSAWPAGVRYGDVVKGLPVPFGSCAGIYSSHVIEHLTLPELRRALVHVHDLLVHGGVFRLVTPDFQGMVTGYLRRDDPDALYLFMKRSGFGSAEPKGGVRSRLRGLLGRDGHTWLWDFAALSSELTRAGFVQVRRAEYGDSEDEKFAEVEKPSRWHGALGIECKKVG